MIELRSRTTPSSGARPGVEWTFAGDTLNSAAAIAAAAPAARVQFLTGIGTDPRSEELVEFCERLNVDASGSTVVPDRHLGLYWIETDGQDRRFQYWRDQSAARTALRSGIQLPRLEQDDTIVFSGITLAVAGPAAPALLNQIRRARQAGAHVAFDTNYRQALWSDIGSARHMFEAAFELSDVIVASREDIQWAWSLEPDAFCRQFATNTDTERQVLVTDGANGATTTIDGELHQQRPPPVAAPVDPTGAGDAFFGCFVGHRLAHASVEDALQHALAYAASTVEHHGGLGHRF